MLEWELGWLENLNMINRVSHSVSKHKTLKWPMMCFCHMESLMTAIQSSIASSNVMLSFSYMYYLDGVSKLFMYAYLNIDILLGVELVIVGD